MKPLVLKDVLAVRPDVSGTVHDLSKDAKPLVQLPAITIDKDGAKELMGWLGLLMAEHNYP